MKKEYLYGMRSRGFSLGCQPKNGFVERRDDPDGKYHDIIVYDRELTDAEASQYELDRLETGETAGYKVTGMNGLFAEVEMPGAEEKTEPIPPREAGKPAAEPNGKATIVPMVRELEELFVKLNNRYFDGELETPVITIAPDTCRAYGWFTTWRAWKETDHKDGDGYYEINITSDYLDRTPVEIASTLLHEMVHLHCAMKGIKDTSRGGNYHNKEFKKAAEAHGLEVEKTRKSGFGSTTPTPETAEYLKSLNLKFDLYRPTPEKGKKVVKRKSSTRKYVCPVCGAIIRATKELNVICGDCEVPFELVS